MAAVELMEDERIEGRAVVADFVRWRSIIQIFRLSYI
jgi:hypothetical protein